MKRLMAILLSVMMLMLSIGCGGGGKKETKIGVAMPTQVRQRWNQDGANIEKNLIEQGYQVDLQFADNDTGTQISQINKMIKDGCKVIIIASVDANSLSEVLDKAKAAGCKVIAYDRLIMNTDAVDYYATFDNVAVGTMQAEYIEDKLGLKEGKGPFNMEIMAGSLDDSNAVSLYEGSMDVLRPYLKNGQLVVLSGQEALPSLNNPFKDCDDAEVLKALNLGITNGISDDTFSPDAFLNREMAATMLTRVYKRCEYSTWTLQTDGDYPLSFEQPALYADDIFISPYARESVYLMTANGILNGVGDGLFAPNEKTSEFRPDISAMATRQQALLIAVRMLETFG